MAHLFLTNTTTQQRTKVIQIKKEKDSQKTKDIMVKIVVVGGGYCGATFVQSMAPKCKGMDVEFIILEKQKFIFHAIAATRALVNPSYVKKLFIPLHYAFDKMDNVTVIQACAESVSETSVMYRTVLDDGVLSAATLPEECTFDYLILATGSSYPSPIKPVVNKFNQKDVEDAFTAAYTHIKASERVLVIGGGAVGVEVAGEIKAQYPEKSVQLIDGNTALLARPNLTAKFRRKLLKEMKKMGIEVLLGERLEERLDASCYEKRTLTTVSGTTLTADVQLLCAGARPCNDYLKSLGPDLLDDKGIIQVKPTFQLKDEKYQRIFALGDASNHATPKMAYWGSLQAVHLAKYLHKHLKNGKDNLVLPPFQKITTEAIMVPLGPKNGVTQLPLFGGVVMGSTTTIAIKSKDLFVSQFFGQFGAPIPKEE
jgi:NADH dehydrogenase FAD-containing subunit